MYLVIYTYAISTYWQSIYLGAKCLFDCIILFEISESKCDKRMSPVYNQTTLIYLIVAQFVIQI